MITYYSMSSQSKKPPFPLSFVNLYTGPETSKMKLLRVKRLYSKLKSTKNKTEVL